ncbi:MAG: hypothetical protein WA949_11060 [Phormidesmis sp.]
MRLNIEQCILIGQVAVGAISFVEGVRSPPAQILMPELCPNIASSWQIMQKSPVRIGRHFYTANKAKPLIRWLWPPADFAESALRYVKQICLTISRNFLFRDVN